MAVSYQIQQQEKIRSYERIILTKSIFEGVVFFLWMATMFFLVGLIGG